MEIQLKINSKDIDIDKKISLKKSMSNEKITTLINYIENNDITIDKKKKKRK